MDEEEYICPSVGCDEWTECGACDGSGENLDGYGGCYSCGGSGEHVIEHCCNCGGSPYCLCCSKCGAYWEHDEAARLWVVLDDLVDDLDADQRGRLLKQELIANSDSSTRLVFGPRGAFSRLVGRSS